MAAPSATGAPAFSIFWSSTKTLPARINACARSRLGTSPRSTNTRSSRSLDIAIALASNLTPTYVSSLGPCTGHSPRAADQGRVQSVVHPAITGDCKNYRRVLHRIIHTVVDTDVVQS